MRSSPLIAGPDHPKATLALAHDLVKLLPESVGKSGDCPGSAIILTDKLALQLNVEYRSVMIPMT